MIGLLLVVVLLAAWGLSDKLADDENSVRQAVQLAAVKADCYRVLAALQN